MSQLMEGQPVQIGARELVPVVRREVSVQRGALVGRDGVAGWGGGEVILRPIAVLVRGQESERRIPIHDRTVQLIGGLLLAAFVIPLLMMVAVRVARRR